MNGAKKSKQLCLEMFLDMIPKNMVFSEQYDCFSGLSNQSYKSQLNGDFRYSKMFEKKFAFPADEHIPDMPDLCAEGDVDNLSDVDRNESKYSFSTNNSSPGSDDFKLPQKFKSSEKSFEENHRQRKLKVKCLQSVETLQEICKNEGLKFNDCSKYYGEMKSDSEDGSEAGEYDLYLLLTAIHSYRLEKKLIEKIIVVI